MNIEVSSKEYEKLLKWEDGLLYCQLLEIDDKNDWRMPTIEELQYLDSSHYLTLEAIYWSSSIIYYNKNYVSHYFWIAGYPKWKNQYHHEKYFMYLIRPVRDII